MSDQKEDDCSISIRVLFFILFLIGSVVQWQNSGGEYRQETHAESAKACFAAS